MIDNDEIFTLEDEWGNSVDYVPARYVMSEGKEYALFAPVGEELSRDNGIVMEVRPAGMDDEEYEQLDDAVGEIILTVALGSMCRAPE